MPISRRNIYRPCLRATFTTIFLARHLPPLSQCDIWSNCLSATFTAIFSAWHSSPFFYAAFTAISLNSTNKRIASKWYKNWTQHRLNFPTLCTDELLNGLYAQRLWHGRPTFTLKRQYPPLVTISSPRYHILPSLYLRENGKPINKVARTFVTIELK